MQHVTYYLMYTRVKVEKKKKSINPIEVAKRQTERERVRGVCTSRVASR